MSFGWFVPPWGGRWALCARVFRTSSRARRSRWSRSLAGRAARRNTRCWLSGVWLVCLWLPRRYGLLVRHLERRTFLRAGAQDARGATARRVAASTRSVANPQQIECCRAARMPPSCWGIRAANHASIPRNSHPAIRPLEPGGHTARPSNYKRISAKKPSLTALLKINPQPLQQPCSATSTNPSRRQP